MPRCSSKFPVRLQRTGGSPVAARLHVNTPLKGNPGNTPGDTPPLRVANINIRLHSRLVSALASHRGGVSLIPVWVNSYATNQTVGTLG